MTTTTAMSASGCYDDDDCDSGGDDEWLTNAITSAAAAFSVRFKSTQKRTSSTWAARKEGRNKRKRDTQGEEGTSKGRV